MPNFSFITRFALVVTILLLTAAAHAVNYQVDTVVDLIDTNTGDGICKTSANTCSLRAAFMQANGTVAVGSIGINVPSGVYRLTLPISGTNGADSGGLNLTAALGVNQAVVVQGRGAGYTIIDGNQLDGVIHVHAGREAWFVNLTIRNGNRTLPPRGGGIYSEAGGLRLRGTIIESNRSVSGGGIYLLVDASYLSSSTIRSNIATFGGGIYIGASAYLQLGSSVIHRNLASSGAGIYNFGGDAVILTSTLSGNLANTNGGGIATVANGTMRIEDSSIIDNDADHDRDQSGGNGGGIYGLSTTTYQIKSSLIARNTVLGFFDDDCNAFVNSLGALRFGTYAGCNFIGSGTRGLVAAESIGPLQNNGGLTLTHALLLGSAAINNGNSFEPFDQRGATRVAGLASDVGAYEFGSFAPFEDLIFRNGVD